MNFVDIVIVVFTLIPIIILLKTLSVVRKQQEREYSIDGDFCSFRTELETEVIHAFRTRNK